jgi:membrane protein implicated in regulation of membrane protease activity
MLIFGLVLVVVAVILVLAEAHLSTGGFIASVAVVALVAGASVLLVGAGAGWLAVAGVAVCLMLASAAGLMFLGRSVGSVRRLRPRAGTEAMIGHIGVVRAGAAGARVFVDGGLWRAQPSHPEQERALHDGDRVVVERVTGLTLGVRKAEEWELNP